MTPPRKRVRWRCAYRAPNGAEVHVSSAPGRLAKRDARGRWTAVVWCAGREWSTDARSERDAKSAATEVAKRLRRGS